MKLLTQSHSTVLIVDDTPENIQILIGLLSDDYQVKAATNGKKALEIATGTLQPDLILLDVMMPEMDGFEVCKQLKANPDTAKIPVIFITAKSETSDEKQGFAVGAVDYITKPFSPPIVKTRVRSQLALYEQSKHLEALVKARTKEIEETRLSIIQRLGRAAEYKDNETGLHVIRMAWYTKLLAEKVSHNQEWIELLYNSAPMHDIGKIGIPDNILCKPGKLDADEWQIMMTHSAIGGEILGHDNSPLLKLAVEVAINHHEKFNGQGYPNGLAGENIPLSARIVAIADVFDALTSERPYKKPWPIEKAINLIKEESGQHFDPKLVPLFIECMPEIVKIKKLYNDTDL